MAQHTEVLTAKPDSMVLIPVHILVEGENQHPKLSSDLCAKEHVKAYTPLKNK